jgi:hypothetical protein
MRDALINMPALEHNVAGKRLTPQLGLRRLNENALVIRSSVDRKLEGGLPSADEFQKQIGSGARLQRLVFDATGWRMGQRFIDLSDSCY